MTTPDIKALKAIADFTEGAGSPPPERLWLIYMASGDTAWCAHPSDNDEPSVAYVRATPRHVIARY